MPSITTSAATNHASITVIQPSNNRMRFTHSVDLLLQKLPPDARMAHSLPGLTNKLLSIAILCDAGCKVFFHATRCEVTHNGVVILQGWHDPHHRLWRICIVDDGWTSNHCIHDNNESHPNIAIANSLYNCNNTQQLTRFYHTCLFSPVLSTLINMINEGYLKGFPGLTAQGARLHITINNATVKGHMDQTRQGQQATQPTQSPIALPPPDDTINFVAQEPNNAMTNLVYMLIHDSTGQIFTDQTGCFPVTSNQGHPYLVIFYVYDTNFISSVFIKNCTKKNSCTPTSSHTSISPVAVSNPFYTKWTMKHPKMWKTSSSHNRRLFSTPHQTFIAPTLPREQSGRGGTTSLQALQVCLNPFLSPTGVA
jgi:hypothetical protein